MARPRAHIDTEALADAFATDGLHGTPAEALARALGVAKPTLYAHGGSKEALFLRAVEAEVERVLDRLHAAEAATAGRSARDHAFAAARALLDHAAARPAGARLLHGTATHARSSVATSIDAALRRPPDRLEGTFRRHLVADGLDSAPAAAIARGLYACTAALAEVRPGERRLARAELAAIAASLVPHPPVRATLEWPSA